MKKNYYKRMLLASILFVTFYSGYSNFNKFTNLMKVLGDKPPKNVNKQSAKVSGVASPNATYCASNANPFVYEVQMSAAGIGTAPTLVRFPYAYMANKDGNINGTLNQSTPTANARPLPTTIGTNATTGTLWGLAWDETGKNLFASAYLKRKTAFKDGTGAIYKVANADGTTPTAPVLFANLNTIFGANTAGADPHQAGALGQTDDSPTIPLIGKVSLGDIDVSKDGALLYAVNMADKKLYILPTTGTLSSSTITRLDIPTSVPGYVAADIRPFAVGVSPNGVVYVGAVSSGESTTRADLALIVWRLDGNVFTRVYTDKFSNIYGADYNKDATTVEGGLTARYSQWDKWKVVPENTTGGSHPQPMLSDIEFSGNKLVLGIRDRYGDQVPVKDKGPSEPQYPRAVGDIINIIPGGDLGFVTETSAATFYKDESGDSDPETGNGGLAVGPDGSILMTAFDAAALTDAGAFITNNYNGAGAQKYNPADGSITGAYDIYIVGITIPESTLTGGAIPTATRFSFGKAGGVGDIEVICTPQPTETYGVGNIIFIDKNADGKYDAGDTLVDNVVVELYNGSTLVTSQTTQNGGRYLFVGLPAGSNYTVKVKASNFATGGPLAKQVSIPGVQSSTSADDGSGENGIDNADPATNGISSGLITLGPNMPVNSGTESGLYNTSDDNNFWGDDNVNLTVDFGFRPNMSLGSTIFNDKNNNGLLDGTDAGIAGVTVKLYAANGTTPIKAADGTTDLTTTTDANGNYIFTNLAPGTYVVGVVAPTAFPVNSDNNTTKPAGDNQTDNNDDGTQASSGAETKSGPIVLTEGDEPLDAAETGQGNTGSTTTTEPEDNNGDMTIDFGFYNPMSIGSTVFADPNNNGKQDAGESGIPMVKVDVYSAGPNGAIGGGDDVLVGTATTDASGNYIVTGLKPGNYYVEIPTVPTAYPLSSTDPASASASNGDNQTDSDDNGIQAGGSGTKVQSKVINLLNGAEPVNAGAETGQGNSGTTMTVEPSDANGDMTIDFGFVPLMSIGSTVFIDSNNNGKQDAGEGGISGVGVEVINVGADGAIGGTDDVSAGTTTTDGFGNYIVKDLAPGKYYVKIATPSAAYPVSSTDPASAAVNSGDNQTDGDDNGSQTGGSGGPVTSKVITLAPDTEPLDAAETGQGGTGTAAMAEPIDANGDMTIDFGFVPEVSIGSTVFVDTNNNGVQDAGENGIPGVKVDIYNPGPNGLIGGNDDVLVGTATTNASGNYIVKGLAPGKYFVEIPTAPTAFPISSTNSTISPAGDNQTDKNDDGNQPDGIGTVTRSGIVELKPGDEPVGAAESGQGGNGTTATAEPVDSNGDMTIDFGFVSEVSIGSTVFIDANNDGVQNPGEGGIAGVGIEVYGVGLDGVIGGGDDPFVSPAGLVTDAFGNYIVKGLTPGKYYVKVPIPSPAYPLSSTDPASANVNSGDNQKDKDDNGFQAVAGGESVSKVITLTAGAEPTDADETGQGGTGTAAMAEPIDANGDMTIDFGFTPAMSIGSTVFKDKDNSGTQTTGEDGIPGVTVNVYSLGPDGAKGGGDDVLAGSDVTDSNGDYLVGNLLPGKYYVEIPTSSIPSEYPTSSRDLATAGDNGTDGDDNGTQAGGKGTAVQSGIFMLMAGAEPDDTKETSQGGSQDTDDTNGDMTIDFGFFAPVSIGSTVFNDKNNNGTQDTGEEGIPGATVTLKGAGPDGIFGNGDDTTASTTTSTGMGAAAGNYYFGELSPGKYKVEVAAPTGFPISSTPTATTDNNVDGNDDGTQASPGAVAVSPEITLVSNDESTMETAQGNAQDDAAGDNNGNMTVDFGFYAPVSIGSAVFKDLNNNGVQDMGEGPLVGATVKLYDEAGMQVGISQTTTATGLYFFDNLVPGKYKVGVTPPASYPLSSTDPASAGDNGTDEDDNGIQTTSGGEALSTLIDLQPTTETISETGIGGSQDNMAGAPDNSGDMTVDFGFVPLMSIGSTVFLDSNNNGIQDLTETPIEGASVQLYNGAGVAIGAPVLTNERGNYIFNNLAPGDYKVGVTPAASSPYKISSTDPASATALSGDMAVDLDDNGIQATAGAEAQSGVITLKAESESITESTTVDAAGGAQDAAADNNGNMTVDFGFYSQLSVGSTVFIDSNNNGKQDAGEPKLSNASVQLYDGAGLAIGAPILTDANGNYQFANLQPGMYKVGVTPPASHPNASTTSDPTNGTDLSNDGVQTTPGGESLSPAFTLSSGNASIVEDTTVDPTGGAQDAANDANGDMTVDFGFFAPAKAGQFVWDDLNKDGIQDAGEPGINNVAVALLKADGTPALNAAGMPITTTTDATGNYSFNNLAPGQYQIKFTAPLGMVASPANSMAAGATDLNDSDASGGVTPVFTI
jgi:protocatechuate 3,4-dioxygenase beta subunit